MAVLSRAFGDFKKRLPWFVLASLLLHAMMLAILSARWVRERLSPAGDRVSMTEVEVTPLTRKEIERIRRQVVETSLAQKTEKAADDAYLGEQTQVVDRQTKAALTAPFRDGRKGGETAKPQPKVAIGDLGVKMNYRPMGHLGPGEMASTSDYLRALTPGAQTMLNTREFAYYSFYQRVRRQLEQYWEPGLKQRLRVMFEKGRRLASDREHSTRLLVVMDGEGTITRVFVQSTSGLLDLDQSAIDAFNKAGPFPNPPRGMVDTDGTVKVEWEFILKT